MTPATPDVDEREDVFTEVAVRVETSLDGDRSWTRTFSMREYDAVEQVGADVEVTCGAFVRTFENATILGVEERVVDCSCCGEAPAVTLEGITAVNGRFYPGDPYCAGCDLSADPERLREVLERDDPSLISHFEAAGWL